MPNPYNTMDRDRNCVIPGPTEEELAVLPGASPGTAFRVRVETSQQGFVRLEQMAYNADLGWYTQKSFCVPAEMLRALCTQLRKADCMMPRGATARPAEESSLRLVPSPETAPAAVLRIEA